jgi:Ca2+-binding RTX toxin-like protein
MINMKTPRQYTAGRPARLAVQSLDQRALPSATVGLDPTGQALVIQGDAGNNVAEVRVVNNTLIALADGAGQKFDATRIRAIVFRGGDGNDVLKTSTRISVIALGGAGNDVLAGGSSADRLFGEEGDDILTGGAGDDWLSGGAGHDVLDGGTGHDYLDGGSGNDKLSGGDGDDVLVGGAGKNTFDGGRGADIIWLGSNDDIIVGGDLLDKVMRPRKMSADAILLDG